MFIVFHSDPKFDSNGCIICDLSINHSKDNLFAKFIEIATVWNWMHIFVLVCDGRDYLEIWTELVWMLSSMFVMFRHPGEWYWGCQVQLRWWWSGPLQCLPIPTGEQTQIKRNSWSYWEIDWWHISAMFEIIKWIVQIIYKYVQFF